jgi:CHAT domain-containing protein
LSRSKAAGAHIHRASIWKNIFGGSYRRAQQTNFDDAPVGARFPNVRLYRRTGTLWQRPAASTGNWRLILWLLIFAGAAGGCRPAPDPSQTYVNVVQKTQNDNLEGALRDAGDAQRKYENKNIEWAWRFRVLKAQILVMRGAYKDSLALVDENVPAAFAHSDLAARRKMVRGLANEYLERFDESATDLTEAEKIADASHPQLQAEIARAIGTLEADRKNYDVADAALRRGLLIARQHNLLSLEVSILGDLGYVAMKREHYDEAIDWDRSALQMSQDLKTSLYTSGIEGNMGWSYFSMGDFENAKSLFDQAETASARAGLSSDHINWLVDIGVVQFAQHNYGPAESTMKQALTLARDLHDNGSVIQCLNYLSQMALESGAIDTAEKYNTEASALQHAGLDQLGVLKSTLVAGRIESAKHHFAEAEQNFTSVIENPGAESSLRWEAESRLAKVFEDMDEPAKAEQEFRKSIETIDVVRSSVKSEEFRMSFLSSAVAFYNDFISFLISRGRAEDALEVAEISRARTLAEGLGVGGAEFSFPIKNFQPKQIASRLKTVVLSYWLGSTHSYLWVVTAAQVKLITLPPASKLDPLVESYRSALLGPRDVLETQNPAGKKLYDVLVAPAQSLIPKNSHVTILPDGSLYNLNFETLLATSPQLHYWIDDAVISNANSLTLLSASLKTPPLRSKTLLLVGDPISPNSEFPNLPLAAAEMERIEKYFPTSTRTVLARGQASSSQFIASRPEQFSFIHFVAHSTSSRISPLDSAVILTKEGDSYKLYARDIVKEHLHADLVTISACHGEGARTYSGEGLVGLTWAFLRAGAHGVIAALWEVSDNSTPQMMDRLYAEMSRGIPPDIALRDAKLALLHSDTVFRKPFYWAPFQLHRGS